MPPNAHAARMWGFRLGGEPQPSWPAGQCQGELGIPQPLKSASGLAAPQRSGGGRFAGRNGRAGVERNKALDSAAIKSKVDGHLGEMRCHAIDFLIEMAIRVQSRTARSLSLSLALLFLLKTYSTAGHTEAIGGMAWQFVLGFD